jgi:hypothetical protein
VQAAARTAKGIKGHTTNQTVLLHRQLHAEHAQTAAHNSMLRQLHWPVETGKEGNNHCANANATMHATTGSDNAQNSLHAPIQFAQGSTECCRLCVQQTQSRK